MRIFMLGWEFPPHISGGLGTACYGMTKGLDEIGVNVCFVLPTAIPVGGPSHVALRTPADIPTAEGTDTTSKVFEHVTLHQVQAALQPYASPGVDKNVKRFSTSTTTSTTTTTTKTAGKAAAQERIEQAASVRPRSFVDGSSPGPQYAGNLLEQVHKYARTAVEIAFREQFDVIHAHDWMTYPAALAVAAATGKPLVVHVHSTEFDRSGDNVYQAVYDIERSGMQGADRVVCVSHLTRNIVISRYGIAPDKVEVVYNAVELPAATNGSWTAPIRQNEKIVLFLGRLTMQKGPEYFLQAARKVVDRFKKVRFIMAGSGDMITQCVRLAADLKLGRHVTFTGFLRGNDVDRVFRMADLYVMPSVSEPFGIAPLEAMGRDVPVIISKQSGVSEVLTHALKVDFWDVDEMANKILAVLRHAPLQKTLRQHGSIELRKFSWRDTAARLSEIYSSMTATA